mmetsp:Transcript_60313/g.73897  ORF Transcript_60313/g.73897 Transcript_60313/m.73897 type:complete len:271 (+) Transcript_60313:60-872(+)
MWILFFSFVLVGAVTDDCEVESLVQVKSQEIRARHCEELAKDDCSFHHEKGGIFKCGFEHASRLMYITWFRPDAKVLEIGARYGQTGCLLSTILQREAGAELVSADADPNVWDVLEGNFKQHKCWGKVVRGPVGTNPVKIKRVHSYGTQTGSVEDRGEGVIVPATPLESLNTTFDTLSVDCEGCFSTFLEENPQLLESLTMIMAEVHNDQEEATVQRLLAEGWELKQQLLMQRVLCKGSCNRYCDEKWVVQHAAAYWPKQSFKMGVHTTG